MAKKTRIDSEFRFNKFDKIGAIDAHDDSAFLETCFVDSPGVLECLQDMSRNERIILGRTGAGKTALIERLKAIEERVSVIEPENLSLQYLSNSPILKHLESEGIHLDLFYKLLWKHIFLIEILSLKFGHQTKTFQDWFEKHFASKVEKSALKYAKDWGGSFFLIMEKRVVEIESTLTQQIASELGISADLIKAKLSEKEALSESEKTILHQKAQEVVNKIQIENLNQIIDKVAKEAFSKPEPKFYLVVDKLDENWAETKIRFQLIRALLDTVRDFANKFKNVKIVLALREDLLHSVFKHARKDGLQEQKYNSFYLRLKWNQKDLIQILDKRLQALAIKKGFSSNFPFRKLYPDKVGMEPFNFYFTRRTLLAPRDVVDFFNICIENADGKERVGPKILKIAEGYYSKSRLTALFEEWVTVYPNLKKAVEILKSVPRSFLVGELDKTRLDDLACTIKSTDPSDEISKAIDTFLVDMSDESIKCKLAHIFYKVGLIGFKMEAYETISWSFSSTEYVGAADIKVDSRVEICPAFYRSLGIDGTND